MLAAVLAQCLKKTWCGRYTVHVAGNGLDYYAGDFVAIFGEETFQCCAVVIGEHMGEVGIGLRDAQ